jgi:MSHA pilin protein MshA
MTNPSAMLHVSTVTSPATTFKKRNIAKASGFTLIELIAVIVILGILAATAIPKFVSLTSDARIAKLNAAVGSLKSISAMAHGKYLVTSPAPTTATFEGVTVNYTNEYPNALTVAAAAGLTAPDFSTAVTAGVMTATELANCTVSYTEASASATVPPVITPPVVATVTTGC